MDKKAKLPRSEISFIDTVLIVTLIVWNVTGRGICAVRQVAMLFTPAVLENPSEPRDREGCCELRTGEYDEHRSRDADCVDD